MGLPVFPDVCAGFLPMIIINIVMSVALIKHAIHSFFQILGLLKKSPQVGDASSIHEECICPGIVLPGYTEEISRALPLEYYVPERDAIPDSVDPECSVCLCEFQRDQEVRRLPRCRHLFHRGCLDQWLEHNHTTCPLCRISLVPEEISRKWLQKEQEVSEDLSFWLSSSHGSGFHGLWCHL